MLFYIHLWYPSRFLFSWFFLSVKLHTFSHTCNFLHMLVNEWRIHVCSWKDYLGDRFNVLYQNATKHIACMYLEQNIQHEKNIKSCICIDVRECLFHHLIKKMSKSSTLLLFLKYFLGCFGEVSYFWSFMKNNNNLQWIYFWYLSIVNIFFISLSHLVSWINIFCFFHLKWNKC